MFGSCSRTINQLCSPEIFNFKLSRRGCTVLSSAQRKCHLQWDAIFCRKLWALEYSLLWFFIVLRGSFSNTVTNWGTLCKSQFAWCAYALNFILWDALSGGSCVLWLCAIKWSAWTWAGSRTVGFIVAGLSARPGLLVLRDSSSGGPKYRCRRLLLQVTL
jgi:hypothetical protein